MNLKTFIDRPILSVAISIFLVLVGIIGLAMLPVEQYPDIAPPTIRVSTTYSRQVTREALPSQCISSRV